MAEHDNKRLSAAQMLLWVLLAVLTAYVALFCLLCLDEFLMSRNLIQEPLRTYLPAVHDPFIQFCRLIYYPEIQVMKAMKIIPA